MVSIGTFTRIKRDYGHYASWAVWAEQGSTPKSNIADLSVLDPQINPTVLGVLKVEVVFLGLNISRRIDCPLGNFHDPRPMATDYKIRYALNHTEFWGAYMTDIIKDFEEKASGKMMKYLRTDPTFEKENVKIFRSEISALGCQDPLLVAFGKDAEVIARRNLDGEFRICAIPHYATYTSMQTVGIRFSEFSGDNKSRDGSGCFPAPVGL